MNCVLCIPGDIWHEPAELLFYHPDSRLIAYADRSHMMAPFRFGLCSRHLREFRLQPGIAGPRLNRSSNRKGGFPVSRLSSKTTSEKGLTIHPLCAAVPPMSQPEVDALQASIEVDGILTPIRVWKGQVVDGRHRYVIGQRLGIKVPTEDWSPKGPVADAEHELAIWIETQAFQRRHLSVTQRVAWAARAIVEAGKLNGRPKKGAKSPEFPVRTKAEWAARMGVSERYIQMGVAVAEGAPELLVMCLEDRLSICNAEAQVRDKRRPSRAAKKTERREQDFGPDVPEDEQKRLYEDEHDPFSRKGKDDGQDEPEDSGAADDDSAADDERQGTLPDETPDADWEPGEQALERAGELGECAAFEAAIGTRDIGYSLWRRSWELRGSIAAPVLLRCPWCRNKKMLGGLA